MHPRPLAAYQLQQIQAAAGRVGESMNQYIKGAIDQRLARDKATAGADNAVGSEGETE